MDYRFYGQDEKAQVGIKLVFQSPYPKLQRWGAAEDFADIDIQALDELVLETAEKEQKKVKAARKALKDKKLVNQYLEAVLIPLRNKAGELFDQMLESKGDAERFRELNAEMMVLTERERALRKAFSAVNPWCQHYGGLQMPDGMLEAVEQITVRAQITDDAWARNPVYPMGKPQRRKGMTMQEVMCLRGSTTMMDPDYRWPAMEIAYEPVPRFTVYRDLLPSTWLC